MRYLTGAEVRRAAACGELIGPTPGLALGYVQANLVVVPRGTPHQRSTANQDFTMILIKIYQEPLKKRP